MSSQNSILSGSGLTFISRCAAMSRYGSLYGVDELTGSHWMLNDLSTFPSGVGFLQKRKNSALQ